MITLIVGSRGSGKTKQMVEMINTAVKTAAGNIVCIEKGMKLTYDLDHKCRLIDMEEYKIQGCDMLYGFISGILAGNYDISEVYVDGILKILNRDLNDLGRLLAGLEALGGEDVKFVITVSSDMDTLPDSVKKYA
jgi:energy-coupling factor transporter ATP-binding protein EcfA2